MRAATPVLPGEDDEAFDDRLQAWTKDLGPRDDVEHFLVRRAVQLSWQLERADRALAARGAEGRLEYDEHVADIADEVANLGRRLFWSPRGPLPLYPLGTCDLRYTAAISWSGQREDPDDPARLVILLEATPLGCAWMLDRWAELRELLEGGLDWLASDRFKAIRLLGRQPLDATEDERVRMIYLACWAMKPEGENAFADLRHELGPVAWGRWLGRLEGRESAGSGPRDAAAGRAVLLELIAGEEERLQGVLAQHVEREESSDFGRLFDTSPDGERLRRYQASCDRTLLRVLETLRKRRREAEGQTSSPRRPARPKKMEEPKDSAAGPADLLGSPAPGVTNEAKPRPDGPVPTAADRHGCATNEANRPAEPGITTNEANRPAAEPGRAPGRLPAAIRALLALVLAAGIAAGLVSRAEVVVMSESSDPSPATAPVATVGQPMTAAAPRPLSTRPTASPPAWTVA